MASTLSGIIGKTIQFVPVKPDDFEAQLAGSFGKDTAREIANIYRYC
jgi:NAD(P)H dehydrogenase (quinone)